MRPKLLAYIIWFMQCPVLLFAANAIEFSSDYVDPATGTTLAEMWKHASIENPDIKAANRKVLEAKALRRQAALFPNPELEIEAETSSVLGEPGDREWGARLVQTFELGGKRSKRVRAADL